MNIIFFLSIIYYSLLENMPVANALNCTYISHLLLFTLHKIFNFRLHIISRVHKRKEREYPTLGTLFLKY